MKYLAILPFLFGCNDLSIRQVNEEVVYENLQLDGGFVYDQAVDILFVVDESGSMNDEQELLRLKMSEFYETLNSDQFTDLKWRVGIKSSDPDDGGIYGSVDWDSETPMFDLSALTLLLGNNSGEVGFSSAIDSMINDDFFHRPNADLLIVYISDEEEQSDMTLAEYESTVALFKEQPFIVTESAITVTYLSDIRCNVTDQLGQRYIDVSEVSIDLCDTQGWINVLDNVSNHIPTLNKRWQLSETPILPEDIMVEVNGEENFDWTYDDYLNSVILDNIPPTGSYVSIAYYF